ncbi:MAG: YcxB family protein [Candidatus Acinetobacter avistercoris]|uniref:YcxB family protein n=1 Tax=Acinetobacter sp. KS-LM10 TaxID=3120518 RepID=UPI001FA1EA3E|nr:YcxB family protein [Candidatus Acinetobacter avistercoris]
MSDTQATLSIRYFLTLEESQDGFALATFGKKQLTRFLTPLVSVAIVIWGLYLGLDGVGRYYVALGGFFIILQMLMRYWFLPMMFKRQFVKYQFGKSEQGIDLFQDSAELFSSGRPKQAFNYNDVNKFVVGKLTYMIELKNQTVVIIPKRAFETSADQTIFENTFHK